MRFIINKGERTLADLVKRLFKFQGPNTGAQMKDARGAILRANPHLDAAEIGEGALVFVPEIAGAQLLQETPFVEGPGGQLLKELHQALGKARVDLEASAERADETARQTLALLSSDTVRQMA